MLRTLRVAAACCVLSSTVTVDAASVVGPAEAEQGRLRRHFADVVQLMKAHPPAGLDAATLTNRDAVIAELARYADQGVFPRNSNHPNQRQPYFIDDANQTCAVAHLMVSTGYETEARAIAMDQNNAYVHGIQSPVLAQWLVDHGVTLEEAALIQPGYCSCPDDEQPVCGDNGESYLNECVASRCAGVDVVGCDLCAPEDAPSTGGAIGDPTMLDDYCAANTCMCPIDDTPNDEADDDGCAVASAGTSHGSGAGWWALLAIAWVGLLHRRKSTRKR